MTLESSSKHPDVHLKSSRLPFFIIGNIFGCFHSLGTFPVLCCLNSDTSHGVWAQRLSVSQNLRPKCFGREWIFFSPLQKMCCTILNIEVKWSDFRDERRYAVPVFLNRNLSLSGTPFCVDDDRHYAKFMESMNCVSLNQSQRKKCEHHLHAR